MRRMKEEDGELTYINQLIEQRNKHRQEIIISPSMNPHLNSSNKVNELGGDKQAGKASGRPNDEQRRRWLDSSSRKYYSIHKINRK